MLAEIALQLACCDGLDGPKDASRVNGQCGGHQLRPPRNVAPWDGTSCDWYYQVAKQYKTIQNSTVTLGRHAIPWDGTSCNWHYQVAEQYKTKHNKQHSTVKYSNMDYNRVGIAARKAAMARSLWIGLCLRERPSPDINLNVPLAGID